MAKFVFVAVLFLAAVVVSTAAPTEGEDVDVKKHMEPEKIVRTLEGQESEEDNDHIRIRRGACDTFGALGNAACATSCVATGKASGSCYAGVCVCSWETVGDKVG